MESEREGAATWQEGDELVEERHALVAALGLRAAALLQEPQDHVGEAELLVGGEAPGGRAGSLVRVADRGGLGKKGVLLEETPQEVEQI